MMTNLEMTGPSLLAEPLYILLAEAGRADAHEIVRSATLAVEREGIGLAAALMRVEGVYEQLCLRLRELGHADPADFFSKPQAYRGRAAERALKVGLEFKSKMDAILAEGGKA
jgi:adenylosuccinate lyase